MKNFFIFLIYSCFLSTAPCLAQKNIIKPFPPESQEGNGLMGEYFNGQDFREKVHSRIDEEINFFYRTVSPAPGVLPENYSIRWTGSLFAPVTGTYKVAVRVDDGVRLWVNDVKVLDAWVLQRASTHSGYVELIGGEFYSLKIEYFNGPTFGIIQLMWETPEDKTAGFFGLREDPAQKIIPKKYLYGELPEKDKEHKDLAKEEADPGKAPEKNSPSAITQKEATERDITPAAEKEEIFENLKPGAVITFKNVLFEQGKYILIEDSYTELDKLLRTMLKHPELRIRIDGHTDNVGDPNLNLSLSFFRAKVVETYLVEKGIEVSRIEVKGHGSSRPLADNSTEDGRAQNRRVEFVVK